MLKKFIHYYKAHKGLLIKDLISAFFVAGVDLLYPIATRAILNDFIPNQSMKMILYVGMSLFFIYIIRARLKFFIAYQGHMMGAYIERDMRRDLFHKYEEMDYEFYDDNKTGVLMSYLTNHLHDIAEMSHHVPEDLFISGIMFIGSFIYLATINLLLTVLIFTVVILVVVYSAWRRKKLLEAQRSVRRAHAELNSKIESSLSGIRLTKAYNNEEFELDRFSDYNESYAFSSKEVYHELGYFQVGNEFLLQILNLVVLVIGGVFVYNGHIDYVDLFTYYLYISFLTRPINRMISTMQQIQRGMSGFEKFYQVMQIEPKIVPTPNAPKLVDPEGRIIFDDVSFNYKKGGEMVLDHFNLTVEPGETVALIGETGVGKSTISKLIPRFYDVDSGKIEIDGRDIREYDLFSLRHAIGHVQQDVFIFYGTIKDNILYGNPDATDEEIVAASKHANIHDYIISLPDGYMTLTGERGVKLSGGQKQRIAIARLFLKQPKIIILDEATSSLDNVTERMIQSSFNELSKGRTSIVIAHRLSTIRDADKILVLGKDGILESGDHASLVAKKGIYHDLLQE